MSWFHSDISKVLVAPVRSTPADRSALRTLAVVGQFGLDLDVLNPRFGKRDIDGLPGDETTCNIFLRDYCAAMGVPLEGARANDMVAWLASPAAREKSWATISEHAALGCAAEGFPVIVGWHSRGQGPGHVALVVPSLDEPGTWIAQAGGRCFSRGLLASGFGSRSVTFFAHP